MKPLPALSHLPENHMSIEDTTVDRRGEALRQQIGLLTEEDVAAMFGIKVGTLRNWRVQGEGPRYTKAGNGVFYRVAAIEDYLERQEAESAR
jgi:hypothetical protein